MAKALAILESRRLPERVFDTETSTESAYVPRNPFEGRHGLRSGTFSEVARETGIPAVTLIARFSGQSKSRHGKRPHPLREEAVEWMRSTDSHPHAAVERFGIKEETALSWARVEGYEWPARRRLLRQRKRDRERAARTGRPTQRKDVTVGAGRAQERTWAGLDQAAQVVVAAQDVRNFGGSEYREIMTGFPLRDGGPEVTWAPGVITTREEAGRLADSFRKAGVQTRVVEITRTVRLDDGAERVMPGFKLFGRPKRGSRYHRRSFSATRDYLRRQVNRQEILNLHQRGIPMAEIATRLDLAVKPTRDFVREFERALTDEEFKRLRIGMAGGRMESVKAPHARSIGHMRRARLEPHSIWESRTEADKAADDLRSQGFVVKIRPRSLRHHGSYTANRARFGPPIRGRRGQNRPRLDMDRPRDYAFGLYIRRLGGP